MQLRRAGYVVCGTNWKWQAIMQRSELPLPKNTQKNSQSHVQTCILVSSSSPISQALHTSQHVLSGPGPGRGLLRRWPSIEGADALGPSMAKPRESATEGVLSLDETDRRVRRDDGPQEESFFTRSTSQSERPASRFGLEPVLARRKSWTPPPEMPLGDLEEQSPMADLDSSVQGMGGAGISTLRQGSVFDKLRDNFGFSSEEEASSRAASSAKAHALVKGKAISAVDIGSTTESSRKKPRVIKPKADKKKAKTITELAVAPYTNNPHKDESLATSKTFIEEPAISKGAAATGGGMDVCITGHPASKPRKKRSTATGTSTGQKGTRRTKATTTRSQRAVLKSPSSAMKESWEQDLVFGTSSQLTREEASTRLRGLDEDLEAWSSTIASALADESVYQERAENRLWTMSARGIDGSLSVGGIIDLGEDVSFADDPFSEPLSVSCVLAETLPTPDTSLENMDSIDSLSVLASSPLHKNPSTAAKALQTSCDPVGASFRNGQPASARLGIEPELESMTDAQLEEELSSFGYKPISERGPMIALLRQCRQATGRTAQGSEIAKGDSAAFLTRERSKSVETVFDRTRSPTPRIQRGLATLAKGRATQSRSMSTAQFAFEIEDSESESRLTSPDPCPSSPSDNDMLSPDEQPEELSLVTDSGIVESEVFQHITKAVMAEPRTRDPAIPSWHEKILMYDIIVIETFTSWLNSGSLQSVGYDKEVEHDEVKKWCESKSICCTWKTNLHGKERKRN